MSSQVQALLLFIHLLGVVVWLGGMVFTHFVLRPAAVQVLEPPRRLPLLSAALQRFFLIVAFAVLAIVASGLAIMLSVGFAHAPVGWHVMLALGLLMAIVFAFIYGRLYPQLRTAVAGSQWPIAAAAMDSIRKLVFLNLCLGVLTVAAAVSVRVL